MKTSTLPSAPVSLLRLGFVNIACLVTALSTVFLSAAAAQSVLPRDVVKENFEGFSAGPTANGWYFYNASSNGAGWTVSTDAVNATNMSGNKLANPAGNTTNSELLHQFTPVTLVANGDSVTLQFDLRLRNGSANGVLIAGLYDLSTQLSENIRGGTSPISGKSGYSFEQAFNSTSATYKNGAGSTVGSSISSGNIGDFAEHRLSMTLKLTDAGLEISSSLDGNPLSTTRDSSVVGSFTVNTLRIASHSISQAFFIDNVIVSTTAAPIPESATTAILLAFAMFMLAAWRTRQRSS